MYVSFQMVKDSLLSLAVSNLNLLIVTCCSPGVPSLRHEECCYPKANSWGEAGDGIDNCFFLGCFFRELKNNGLVTLLASQAKG